LVVGAADARDAIAVVASKTTPQSNTNDLTRLNIEPNPFVYPEPNIVRQRCSDYTVSRQKSFASRE
jgi:hypothetical protein